MSLSGAIEGVKFLKYAKSFCCLGFSRRRKGAFFKFFSTHAKQSGERIVILRKVS